MIADDKPSVLISSMGWVDRHELWAFDVATDSARQVSIGSEAKYLAPHVGTGDFFSVGHHFDGPRFDVTVHAFSAAAARSSTSAKCGRRSSRERSARR